MDRSGPLISLALIGLLIIACAAPKTAVRVDIHRRASKATGLPEISPSGDMI